MATIRNRDGRWQACVRGNGFPSVSQTFHRHADAARWAKDVEIQRERGTYRHKRADTDGATLGGLLATYLARVVPTKRGGEREGYLLRRVMQDLRDLCRRRAGDVHATDIASVRDLWLRDGYAPASVVRRLALVGHCYEMAAKEWNHVGLVNPVRGIRMPRLANARSRVVSDDELDRIYSATESDELPALILLLADTAMRRSEALGLEAHRVDFQRHVARLETTKNGRPRDVPLSPRAASLLRSLTPQRDGRFFTISGCTASGAWRRAVTRAREFYVDECALDGRKPDPRFLVDLNLHDLRHTRLSRLAMAGLSPVQLMGISGHVTLGQLARYSHITTSHLVDKLQAIEAADAMRAANDDAEAAARALTDAVGAAVDATRAATA